MALAYLETMRTSPLVSDDAKQTIAYEEGATLVDEARQLRDTVRRVERLEEARRKFDEFLKAHPQHPLAPTAASQLGNILVERGRTALELAKRPTQAAGREQHIAQARQLFTQAQQVFNHAEAQFEAELKKFPKIIDPKDQKRLDARDRARLDLIQARLLSATVLYEMTKTHEPASAEHKQLLAAAAAKYEEIYKKHGRLLAGLYARMWEGRCYLDQGDAAKALLAFEELLAQPDKPEEFHVLKRKVLPLALEAWLDDKEKKYDKAIELGEAWMKEAQGPEEKTPEGLAIRWHTAEAYYRTAQARKVGDKAKEDDLKAAAGHAAQVARSPGDYQAGAKELAAQLRQANGSEPEPANFAEARTQAKQALDEMTTADQQIRLAQTTHLGEEKIPEWEKAKAAALDRALRDYRLALALREPHTPIEEVNEIRYYLTYLFYDMQRYYDAAVLGEFLARRYPEASVARPAAKIALASYLQAYNAQADNHRQFETERMIALGQYLAGKWPGSTEADEAWMILADLFLRANDLPQAVKMLDKIPPDSPQRGEADLKQGQAYWVRYLTASRLRAEERPPQAQLDDLVARAQETLQRGVGRMREQIKNGAELTPAIVTAELSLAQLYNGSSQYEKAVELLERPETGPLALIAAKSPLIEQGNLAAEASKAALRAYVGSQRLDQAKQVMTTLEAQYKNIPNGDASLTKIYLGLGLELEEQVARLRAQKKDAELAKILGGFELFLDRIAGSEQGNTFSSLNWVAETFFRMAEGLAADKAASAQAQTYYTKAAAAYDKLLAQAEKDPRQAANVNAVRIRLARCQRGLGNYKEALRQLVGILQAKPNALEAQIEAASTYQLWGEQNPVYYQRAIHGRRADDQNGPGVDIWGWNGLARRVQRLPKYKPLYDEARYNLAECSFKFAAAKSGDERNQGFSTVEKMIGAMAQLDPDLGGDQWRQKYDRLLRTIQTATNRKAEGLPKQRAAKQPAATTASGQRSSPG